MEFGADGFHSPTPVRDIMGWLSLKASCQPGATGGSAGFYVNGDNGTNGIASQQLSTCLVTPVFQKKNGKRYLFSFPLDGLSSLCRHLCPRQIGIYEKTSMPREIEARGKTTCPALSILSKANSVIASNHSISGEVSRGKEKQCADFKQISMLLSSLRQLLSRICQV